jgi:hypothetical protein
MKKNIIKVIACTLSISLVLFLVLAVHIYQVTKPVHYNNSDLKDTHSPATSNRIGMKVNAADFDRFAGNIGVALAKNGVNSTNNKTLVDDLAALLYTTKADIVQR